MPPVDKITIGSNSPRPADASTRDTGATATMNADVAATVAAGKKDNETRNQPREGEDDKAAKRREEKAASEQPKFKEEEIDDLDVLEAGGWLLNLLVKKNLISRVEALLGVENEAEDRKKAKEERKKRKAEKQEEKTEEAAA